MSEENVDNSILGGEAVTTEPTEAQAQAPVDFKSTLSEDLRGHKSLEKFKNADDLAKSYLHAESMIGGSIRIPSDDAGDEQRTEFLEKLKSVDGVIKFDPNDLDNIYSKLGRPETAEQYEITVPDELKDVSVNNDTRAEFQKLAHELGLSNDQASKLLTFDLIRGNKRASEVSQLHDQSMANLKEEFGDEYKNVLEVANATLNKISKQYPDLKALIDNVPEAGNNAGLIALLGKYGKSMVEKGTAEYKGVGRIGVTPEEAQQRIADKKLDKDFMDAWMMPNAPGHAAAVETMNQLYKLAHPG